MKTVAMLIAAIVYLIFYGYLVQRAFWLIKNPQINLADIIGLWFLISTIFYALLIAIPEIFDPKRSKKSVKINVACNN
jgi:uncharacterized membrane protein YedE/YeeE